MSKEWKAHTKKKYKHTVAPLGIAHRDGKTILSAELRGKLEYSFVLDDGTITSLEIR